MMEPGNQTPNLVTTCPMTKNNEDISPTIKADIQFPNPANTCSMTGNNENKTPIIEADTQSSNPINTCPMAKNASITPMMKHDFQSPKPVNTMAENNDYTSPIMEPDVESPSTHPINTCPMAKNECITPMIEPNSQTPKPVNTCPMPGNNENMSPKLVPNIHTHNPSTKCTINETSNPLEFDVKNEDEDLVSVKSEDVIDYSNVIILGSVVPQEKEMHGVEKPSNRRKPNELESLGVTDIKEDDDKEFDVFTDDSNKVYKKYRLRTASKKPDYRIPTVNSIPIKYIKEPETYACTQLGCTKTFNNKVKLQTHLRLEHKIKFKCSVCSETFESNTKLVSHKKQHETENRSYICHECRLAFSDHCDYLIHQTTHSKKKNKFECPECGQILFFSHSFQRHVQTHFDKKTTCPICSKELQERLLFEHIKNHNTKIECVECGKICFSEKHYQEHLAIHTGVRIHQCLYCGKGFITKDQKNVHTRIHTNERPYSCTLCDRKFIQFTNLDRHLKRHDTEKRIKCGVCHKKFRQKYDLGLHMRTHKKNYTCPECNERFSIKRSLKNHILLVHSTDRPIECKLCNKNFATQNHYWKHKQSKIHKNAVFKQEKCLKREI